jgi:hypothetical protein
VGAEKRLLGRDQVGAADVADERPRLSGAPQVERDGRTDNGDPDELEAVSEPPAELEVAEEQRGR